MAVTNSRFTRLRANESKLGAYYTDVAHCMDLRKLFRFPKDEVCVLEPCIGDASAVISITDATQNPNIKIFGVELNNAVAKVTKANPFVTELLEADFTCDVMIRKNSFSFCFANPPYMAEQSDLGESKIRLEIVFLEKIPNYLKIGGVLVWIVPEKSFFETSHLRQWVKNFDTLAYYRFRSDEYSKYKQMVIVGKRIAKREVRNEDLEVFTERICQTLTELPHDLTSQIDVLPSSSEEVDLFTTRIFNADSVHEFLERKGVPAEGKELFDRKITQPAFTDTDLKRPPIPLKKDSLYLLATSGAGQGFTGSVITKDLHLQRGVAEVVEDVRDNYDEEGDINSLTVTQRTAVSMHIVENNGTITTLS